MAAATGNGILTAVDVIADLTGHPLPAMTGGSGECYFEAPYTSVGARVPHLATVTGLHVARRAERHTRTDKEFGTWQARALDDRSVRDRWIAAVRKQSDEATVERLLRGPILDSPGWTSTSCSTPSSAASQAWPRARWKRRPATR